MASNSETAGDGGRAGAEHAVEAPPEVTFTTPVATSSPKPAESASAGPGTDTSADMLAPTVSIQSDDSQSPFDVDDSQSPFDVDVTAFGEMVQEQYENLEEMAIILAGFPSVPPDHLNKLEDTESYVKAAAAQLDPKDPKKSMLWLDSLAKYAELMTSRESLEATVQGGFEQFSETLENLKLELKLLELNLQQTKQVAEEAEYQLTKNQEAFLVQDQEIAKLTDDLAKETESKKEAFKALQQVKVPSQNIVPPQQTQNPATLETKQNQPTSVVTVTAATVPPGPAPMPTSTDGVPDEPNVTTDLQLIEYETGRDITSSPSDTRGRITEEQMKKIAVDIYDVLANAINMAKSPEDCKKIEKAASNLESYEYFDWYALTSDETKMDVILWTNSHLKQEDRLVRIIVAAMNAYVLNVLGEEIKVLFIRTGQQRASMLLKKVLSLDCTSLSPTLTDSKSFTLPGGKIVNGFGCDFGNDETDIFMVPASGPDSTFTDDSHPVVLQKIPVGAKNSNTKASLWVVFASASTVEAHFNKQQAADTIVFNRKLISIP